MKRLITVLVILTAWISQAQISQGNSLINAHVGFGLSTQASVSNGGAGIDVTSKTVIPPIGFSYEYAVQDNITVGTFVAYSNQQSIMTYKDPYDSSSEIKITSDYKYTFFGGLANYHFGFIENEQFDVYGGVKVGYLSFSSDITTSGESEFPSNFGGADVSGMVFGAQVGARYFFTDQLAAHMILGYGVSYVNFGLTYKLGGY